MTVASAGPGPVAVEALWPTVAGVRLRVLAAGPGEPLLLLHGLGGSADEWMGVVPRLAERFRVLAPDAPGHGWSEKPAGYRYSVESYVQMAVALMDTLGIGCAPAIAVSGGGVVALALALEHPERISKLVLVDAAGLGREVAWRYRVATLPLARYALRRARRREIEAFGRAMCYDRRRLPEGWVERRLRIWHSPGAVDAFIATARAGLSLRGQRFDFSRRLGELRQPTLLIWGRQDPILPVAHALAAQRAIPQAELHIFERCGHVPMWEYPQEFAERVLAFLTA
jgi:pimeloyl-ACP methyl ester carboxylesterase